MPYFLKFKCLGKKWVSSLTIIAMFLMMLGLPSAVDVKAASIEDAKDTISSSAPSGSSVTHTFNLTTNVGLVNTDYIEITFASGFTGLATTSVSCPANSTTSIPSAQVLRCTASTTIAAGALTVTVTSMTNPAKSAAAGVADTYTMNIKTKNSGATVIEQADVMVAIIDQVVVTATVSATLSFSVAGLAAADVNGASTTVTATSSTIPFGTLTVNTQTIAAQLLTVTTNADDGFTVTVQQNQNLTSNSGSDIDSFKDGVASTTAVAWTAPTAVADSEATYGHFGFTSEDGALSDADHFGSNLWQGFDGTTAVEVMYHTGPVSATTTDVGYSVRVSALQEAGDYTNTLTYICTPTY